MTCQPDGLDEPEVRLCQNCTEPIGPNAPTPLYCSEDCYLSAGLRSKIEMENVRYARTHAEDAQFNRMLDEMEARVKTINRLTREINR